MHKQTVLKAVEQSPLLKNSFKEHRWLPYWYFCLSHSAQEHSSMFWQV